MRKFALLIDGVRYPLNRENGILLNNVTGLGTTNTNTFSSINKGGFFYLANKEVTQGQVVGDLSFLTAAYTNYKAFADAVLTAESLVLCYDPNGTEYKADVELAYMTKTEMAAGRYLAVPIGFNLLGLWYTEETLTGTGSVSVTAGGQSETAIKVTTSTALTNPTLTITSGSDTVALVEVNDYTTTGVLEYSSYPNDSHITDGGADIISYVDISNTVYGRTRSAFTVSLPTAVMAVTVRKYWRTV